MWRYAVRSDFAAWAIVMVSSAGELAVISDFGNYAYAWRSFGGCFREFLCELNSVYLCGKLRNGRTEYDKGKTRQLIREHILTDRRDGSMSREEARCEWELSDDVSDFRAWYEETSMPDASEFYVDVTPQQLTAFAERLWPKVVELIRADLTAERTPPMVQGHYDAYVGQDAK